MESNAFDGAFKQKAPVRPRRRRAAAEDEDPESSVSPVAGQKKSGWGDEPSGENVQPSTGGGKGRRRLVGDTEQEEAPAPVTTRAGVMSMDDDGDDEPMAFIPDLEDAEETVLASTVAEAPHLKSSRVQTIDELDAAIDMALPSASEMHGIDVSVLQAYLTPQEQVQEEDEPWDFEHELQRLASDTPEVKAKVKPIGRALSTGSVN